MSRLFGPMRQVGMVVRDIEKAMRHWVEVCGVGPWFYAEQRSKPRRRCDRAAFAQELTHQIGTVLGRRDLTDVAAHQAVHAGHRRDHHELLPHIEQDVIAHRAR